MATKKFLGFTLVELLIVMAIIGILTMIGAGNFTSARIKARDAKRKSDLETIAKSLEAYVNDHNRYPSSTVNGTIQCTTASECAWGSEFSDDNGTVYAARLPEDGVGGASYTYNSSSGNSYSLYAFLENENDPSIQTFTPVVACGTKECNYRITSSNLAP